MHGGQSFAFFEQDLEPFFINASEDETFQAMEALVYNLNSMHSRAGAQVPFSSINTGTGTTATQRKIIRNLLLAYKAGLGKGENPIFPNIIFKVKDGVNGKEGDPNYDLFKLALEVASLRLNPTFSFVDSSFNKEFTGEGEVATMGCRTRVIANINGPAVTNGRGNLSFTSINLPRIALKTKNIKMFFSELEKTFDLVVEQLLHRFNIQSSLKVKDMPFIMGQGLYLDSEKLTSECEIYSAIKHGTLSPGFVGLAEALKILTNYHHGECEDSQKLGLKIVEFLRKKCDEATTKYSLNFTLLATPAESTAGRFLKCDRQLFGVIPGVTDKNYYTNSFHIPVDYKINSFDKIRLEAPYHKFCNAGCISYIELEAPPIHNIEAVESIVRHMKDTDCGYVGINFPVDICTNCSYIGVIPNSCFRCNSSNIKRIRRITGYLSELSNFNDSKISELNDRITHQ